jgi:Ulp1 family protease
MEDEQSLRESRPEDGGVFVCLFAVFLQMDYPLVYKQKHILGFRRRIAMCIIHNNFTKAADTK